MDAKGRLQQIQGGKDSLLDEIRRRANEMADSGEQSAGYAGAIALQDRMNAERDDIEAREALRAKYEALKRQYEGYNQNLRNEERRLYSVPRPVDPRDAMFLKALGGPPQEEMRELPDRGPLQAFLDGGHRALNFVPGAMWDIADYATGHGDRHSRIDELTNAQRRLMGARPVEQTSLRESPANTAAELVGSVVLDPLNMLFAAKGPLAKAARGREFTPMRDAAHTLQAPPEPDHILYPREVVRRRELPVELRNDRSWSAELTPRMLDEFEGVRVPGWEPKAKYDIPGPEPLGPVDGLYYHKGLDDSLRQASRDMESMRDPSYYDALMSALADDMDMVNQPKRAVKPQHKLLSPYGNMVDELPVEFRNGGAV